MTRPQPVKSEKTTMQNQSAIRNPQSALKVTVIERELDFASLGEKWNELLARSTANTIFLTWEWLYSWWQHFGTGRRLAIMLIEQNGRLVGIAPFYHEAERVRGMIPLHSLKWIAAGEVGSDYLNLIAEPEYEDAVCDAVCRELGRFSRQWNLLRLTDLPEESRSYLRFHELFTRDQEFESQSGREYICPYIELKSHSWESYLESLSANMRYNLGRRNRQVFRQFRAEIVRCERAEDIAPQLDWIFELHWRRWKLRGGSDGFSGEQIRAFHQTAAARLFTKGWLRLYLLEIEHKPVAGIYGLEYGDTFSFYQSGFDPNWDRYSVGMVLLGQTVKEAISRNLAIYDFLHGTEEYKFKWTQTVRRTRSLLVYPRRRLGPRLYFWLRTLKDIFATEHTESTEE